MLWSVNAGQRSVQRPAGYTARTAEEVEVGGLALWNEVGCSARGERSNSGKRENGEGHVDGISVKGGLNASD